ncbi:hypothetical protein niasHS_012752 [Heterodera schachtii]|uniref:Secreted protein n=1 Tax=Heterodera schachtii TaxID=97005 RepID=A0ABD2IMT8_HETSC
MNSYLALFVFITIIIAVDSGILAHRRFVNQETEPLPDGKTASNPDVIGMNGQHQPDVRTKRNVKCGEKSG